MPRIVLATINAKYIHAAFGLRYLAANMGELRPHTVVREFTLDVRPLDVAEAILAEDPAIVGLGVYIWNVEATVQVVELLRAIAPAVKIVVGGPEVSHEIEAQPWLGNVDYVVRGEGDLAFAELCDRLLSGRTPLQRVIEGGNPDLEALASPYPLYDDDDLRHRVLYVEASRGCPYRCEFCLSSLDKRVRAFPLEPLLAEFDRLIERGARQFKFVDRTFNLDLERSAAILEFFLARIEAGAPLFMHFEMVPDRLPDDLRGLIRQFPIGSLQFEVGIQSLDDDVGARIKRRQNLERTFENLTFLREHTGVHLHTDLIIGLPGEDMATFGAGLDRLLASGVQEVQVGVLKRLRGTPIVNQAAVFGMVFEPRPPYAILRSDAIDFPTMMRLRRFSLVWDTFWNRGELPTAMRALWGDDSPFETTLAFADWLNDRFGRVHGIAQARRGRALGEYLTERRGVEQDNAVAMIEGDLDASRKAKGKKRPGDAPATPARQRRHEVGPRPTASSLP